MIILVALKNVPGEEPAIVEYVNANLVGLVKVATVLPINVNVWHSAQLNYVPDMEIVSAVTVNVLVIAKNVTPENSANDAQIVQNNGVMNSRTVWNARLINLVFLQMSVIVP